ncbi:MAG: type II toxin-antitoxin system VapC family toxin [Cyanobacteria bacterium J06649_4]
MKQALLDTNMLSYFLRGEEKVVNKVNDYLQHYAYLTFSVFTYYETRSGLLYRDAQKQMQRSEEFAEISNAIPFSEEVADTASELYSSLRSKGALVASIDLLIGATAIYYDYVLITANTKDFKNMPGLHYENWNDYITA